MKVILEQKYCRREIWQKSKKCANIVPSVTVTSVHGGCVYLIRVCPPILCVFARLHQVHVIFSKIFP